MLEAAEIPTYKIIELGDVYLLAQHQQTSGLDLATKTAHTHALFYCSSVMPIHHVPEAFLPS